MSDNGNVFRDLGLQQRLNASLIDDLVKAAARARLQGDLSAEALFRSFADEAIRLVCHLEHSHGLLQDYFPVAAAHDRGHADAQARTAYAGWVHPRRTQVCAVSE